MNTYRVLRSSLAASALALMLSPLVAQGQSECEQIRRECLDYCRYGPVSPESGRDCKRECRKKVEDCSRGMRGAEGYPVLPEAGGRAGDRGPGYGAGAPYGYGAPPAVAAPPAGAPAAGVPAAPATAGQAAAPQAVAPAAPAPGYGYGAPAYGYGAPGYGYGAPGYGYGAPYGGVPYGGYGGVPYGAPYGAAPAPAPRSAPPRGGGAPQ